MQDIIIQGSVLLIMFFAQLLHLLVAQETAYYHTFLDYKQHPRNCIDKTKVKNGISNLDQVGYTYCYSHDNGYSVQQLFLTSQDGGTLKIWYL